jgi:O-antigen/teichoic acid export membrane protein
MSLNIADLINYVSNEKLWKPVSSSLLSKAISLLTSWLFLPLLAVSIGPKDFGAYALYLSLLSVLNLADSGIGTAIVRRSAIAEQGYAPVQRAILRASIGFYVKVVPLFILGVGVILWKARVEFAGNTIFLVALALSFALMHALLMPVGRIYAGAGLLVDWYLLSVAANSLFLFGVFLGWLFFPGHGLAFLLLGHSLSILSLPMLGVWRLFYKCPTRGVPVAGIANDCLSEAKSQVPVIVSGVLQREFPKWAVVGVFPAFELGRISLLLAVLSGIGGLVGMFTGVIWPQIIAALGRNDSQWARRSRGFLYVVFGAYATVVCIGLIICLLLMGPELIIKDYRYSRLNLILFSIFAIVVIWDHIHYSILLGINQLRIVARIAILQAAIALLGWLFFPFGNAMDRYLIVQLLAYGACSVWIFPSLVNRRL